MESAGKPALQLSDRGPDDTSRSQADTELLSRRRCRLILRSRSVVSSSPLLSEADRALGRLDGSIQDPAPSGSIRLHVRAEKKPCCRVRSRELKARLQDVLAAEAQILAPRSAQRDVDEVVNYVRAMNHGLERLAELPVSVRLIREIHAELLKGVRGSQLTPGELRHQSELDRARRLYARTSAIFVPPPPHEVAQSLAELENVPSCRRSNCRCSLRSGWPTPSSKRSTRSSMVTAAWDDCLSPFYSANGGRCSKPVLYLSHFFKQHRQEYYDRLQAVRGAGTWEQWLVFLRGIVEVSGEATETARRDPRSPRSAPLVRSPRSSGAQPAMDNVCSSISTNTRSFQWRKLEA